MPQKYYLEIWEELKPTDQKKFREQKKKVTNVKSFFVIEDAWKYVLENKIECYTVYAADCIIDQS